MTTFTNKNPEALTMHQAIEREKEVVAKHRRQIRKARELAAQGRGGDTEIAHVTPGEIVLPQPLQTPAVLDALREAAMRANIPLEQLRVGSGHNSINPQTGQPEFFSIWPTNAPYDPCDHGAQGEMCEGWVPNFLKDKPSPYMPTRDELDRLPDAQKERYAEFYEGTGGFEGVMGTTLPGLGRLFGGVGKLIGRGVGEVADQDAATRAEIAAAYRRAIRNPRPGP